MRFQIESLVINSGHQQVAAYREGTASDLFFTGTESHFVDADHIGGAGLAKASAHASQILQFEYDVFQDMTGPGTFAQTLEEATALTNAATMFHQARQPAGQSLIEPGQQVGGGVFKSTDVQPGFYDWAVGPDIRPA